MNWNYVYNQIEDKKWELKSQRGLNKGSSSDGIAVMSDKLALEYQRLVKIQKHVGCHWFAQRDKRHGMLGKCALA